MAARTINLNGHIGDDVVLVNLLDRTYRLRPVTRSVEKQLIGIRTKIDAIGAQARTDQEFDEEAALDQLVDLWTDGIDALLLIEGSHRTSAKKALLVEWEADKITPGTISGYFDQLQQDEAEARPT